MKTRYFIVCFMLTCMSTRIVAQIPRYWVGNSLYQNNFATPAELSSWNLIEDDDTGSWNSSGTTGNAVLKMDDAIGFYANRLFNETAGVPNLLPLDAINGVVEFHVVKLTGGNQRFFIQVQEFKSDGTYLAQQTILPAKNTIGYFTIPLNIFIWNPLTAQLRFIIGGENYSGNQGTIEFNYFSYYNSNRNWSNTANWSASSGGVGGVSIPTTIDTAVFDNNGKGNCILDITTSVAKLNITAFYTANILQTTNDMSVGAGGALLKGGTLVGGTGNMNFADIIIAGTNFSANNSLLSITGNFTFSGGSYTHNNGTILFNGSSFQQISNPSGGLLHHLTINNAAGVSLGNHLSCDGNVTLLQGILNTNIDTLDLDSTGQLVEVPVNPTSFVSGYVHATRNIGISAGVQSFGGIGLTISETTLLSNATSVVRETGVATNAGGININRYFDIIPAINIGLNASITFSYFDNELNGANESLLFLYKAPLPFNIVTPLWQQQLTSLVNTASNTIFQIGITDFSRWTAVEATTLPLELAVFTATPKHGNVYLKWITLSEINNLYFTIQKSTDGTNFTDLGKISGRGNSYTPSQYEYTDVMSAGISYYRLIQTDNKGVTKNLQTITVQEHTALDFCAFQNRSDELTIQLSGENNHEDVLIELIGSSGNQIDSKLVTKEFFNESIPFSIHSVSTGTYMLSVKNGNDFIIKKIIIE